MLIANSKQNKLILLSFVFLFGFLMSVAHYTNGVLLRIARNIWYSILLLKVCIMTASVVWSEFLATDPEARVRFPALPEKNK
jgi:hypothetical protein